MGQKKYNFSLEVHKTEISVVKYPKANFILKSPSSELKLRSKDVALIINGMRRKKVFEMQDIKLLN